MRTMLRILILIVLVVCVTGGCIYRTKKGPGTNLPPSKDEQGGPWTQGEPGGGGGGGGGPAFTALEP